MLKIDSELCIGCGVCEETCTFAAIEVVDSVAVGNDKCTLCGSCVDACEVGALSIEKAKKVFAVDVSQWKGVLVYAEFRHGTVAPVSYELLGIGRELADSKEVELAAVVLGADVGSAAQELIYHGADTVYIADSPALAEFTDEAYGNVVSDLIQEKKPEIVLAGATAIGRSFMPRVATMVDAGLTADCTQLAISEDGGLLQTRPAFGGNIMATIECPDTRPQMSTVRPLVMKPLDRDESRQGKVVPLDIASDRLQTLVEVIESVVVDEDRVKLNEANVVVAGGRGLDSPEGFEMIGKLADLLGGAVAASRAAVDAGWISYQHQVGQTGKTVAPNLYICCGISGAIQHIVGMQSSDTIIAINNDPDAPIFDVATYGVVGDAYEIVPKLIDTLKTVKGLEL